MTYSRTYPREPAKSGDEMDVVSPLARRIHVYTNRAGVCSKVKRKIRRRERRNLNSHNEG